MRDILEDIFEHRPADPMVAARRGMRPALHARFYKEARAGEAADGVRILLDGRPVRTPARHILAAPSVALAQAIAVEWDAQCDVVDPVRMPLTRLANAIIDGVVPAPQPVAAEIQEYLGSDMLVYRASEPEGLVELQARHWDPVLAWAQDALGAHFELTEGVMHVMQPTGVIAAAVAAIPTGAGGARDFWRLGALSVATTLTGSALLALALAAGRLTVDEAWAAAHVDADWNMARWGRDELALQRRAYDYGQMQAAATVLSLLRGD
jgi:chaperone required for assembly of F1-ATPase